MLHILNNSDPDRIELNALFIQPTYDCALNCPSCYVKAQPEKDKNGRLFDSQIITIFVAFYDPKSTSCQTNQITVSMDVPDRQIGSNMIRALYYQLSHIAYIYQSKGEGLDLPEVHFTFHDVRSYNHFVSDSGISANPWIDVMTFSNLDYEDASDIIKFQSPAVGLPLRRTKINWNLMVPYGLNSGNLQEWIDKVAFIGTFVDSIYLILEKSLVTRVRTPIQKARDNQSMFRDLGAFNTLMNKLPENVRRKITVDDCLASVQKSLRTEEKHGCCSNVSRLVLWPDGTVTGCPYMETTFGSKMSWPDDAPPRRDAESRFLKAAKTTMRTYDFRHCHLPQVYSAVTSRDPSSEPTL